LPHRLPNYWGEVLRVAAQASKSLWTGKDRGEGKVAEKRAPEEHKFRVLGYERSSAEYHRNLLYDQDWWELNPM
jgi:hypothetical protein